MQTQPTPSIEQTPAPATPAPIPKSHVLRWVLGASLLVVAAYAGASYFGGLWPFGLAQPTSSPSPSISDNPTARWKSYTNAATGFGFRYPGDMTIEYTEQDYPDDPMKTWVTILGESNDLGMSVEINNPGRGANDVANPVTGTVVADGVTITYRAGHILPMGETEPGTEFYWQMQFIADGNGYIVEFYAPDGTDRTDLVRNILATFMFENPTSDRKTYTNMKYGFSLQYPTTYTLRTSPINAETHSWADTYFGWVPSDREDILAVVNMPDTDPTSDLDAAFVAVSVTSETQSECGTIRQLSPATPEGTVTIDGISFKKTSSAGAGLGHQSSEHVYSGWVAGKCLLLATVLQTSGYGAADSITHQTDATKVFSALDEILSTFKFTK